MLAELVDRFRKVSRQRLAIGVASAAGLLAAAGLLYPGKPLIDNSEMSSQSRRGLQRYNPTPAEWASLTIQPVTECAFHTEHVTEGKIAVDEDRSTPVYSPYAGRVTRLLARPGDSVTQGQPLFVIEATDKVQAQNDFVAAIGALSKARSQLDLAQLQDRRAKDLFEGKAVPLKDYQQTQATLIQAQSDLRLSQTTLEAARNKLRILGLTDEAISAFQEQGRIDPETPVLSPISGTVVQRKMGPGQYVSSAASEPVFVIADLSTVWLTAFVREAEADEVAVGHELTFTLPALPGRKLSGRIGYVAAAIDPATRRLMVRATVDNSAGQLKPEMFATVTIFTPGDWVSVGVPKQALVFEGDQVRVWVAHEDKTIELRQVKTGLGKGQLVEVYGLKPGEQIVTKGSLFIDRPAGS
jgi:cobalt-zinc-cadmium efflux system membrane fusion protein